jgi:hypothetical protein
MKRPSLIARGTALAACLMIVATPAFAEGKADRARAAIAEATGKIDAADKAGLGSDTPHLTAQASASLRAAQEALSAGHKEDAIAAANHASELADTALGVAQKHRVEQQSHAAAVTAAAQQDSAAANARADSAEQAAASAAADAAAARSAAATPVIVPAPAPTTTVTTETVKSASTSGAARRKVVVRKPAHSSRVASEKTTTTVTTTPGG